MMAAAKDIVVYPTHASEYQLRIIDIFKYNLSRGLVGVVLRSVADCPALRSAVLYVRSGAPGYSKCLNSSQVPGVGKLS